MHNVRMPKSMGLAYRMQRQTQPKCVFSFGHLHLEFETIGFFNFYLGCYINLILPVYVFLTEKWLKFIKTTWDETPTLILVAMLTSPFSAKPLTNFSLSAASNSSSIFLAKSKITLYVDTINLPTQNLEVIF